MFWREKNDWYKNGDEIRSIDGYWLAFVLATVPDPDPKVFFQLILIQPPQYSSSWFVSSNSFAKPTLIRHKCTNWQNVQIFLKPLKTPTIDGTYSVYRIQCYGFGSKLIFPILIQTKLKNLDPDTIIVFYWKIRKSSLSSRPVQWSTLVKISFDSSGHW